MAYIVVNVRNRSHAVTIGNQGWPCQQQRGLLFRTEAAYYHTIAHAPAVPAQQARVLLYGAVRAIWVRPRSEEKPRCWYGHPWDPRVALPAAWPRFSTWWHAKTARTAPYHSKRACSEVTSIPSACLDDASAGAGEDKNIGTEKEEMDKLVETGHYKYTKLSGNQWDVRFFKLRDTTPYWRKNVGSARSCK